MSEQAPEIQSASQYRSAVKQLDQGKRPPFLLRLLMNALESYRQARKMGWSRPQNKYGLTVFQSFKMDPSRDQTVIDLAMKTFLTEFTELDEASSDFVREIHQDPRLMGFVFVHDFSEKGKTYEGLTFSFGRVAEGQTHHRDRIDLIVESEVKGGTSLGLSRIRAYVDPFKLPIRKNPAQVFSHEDSLSDDAHELFLEASEISSSWQDETGRTWDHWTQRYINYFGPRTMPVANSYFPTASQRQESDGIGSMQVDPAVLAASQASKESILNLRL
jgi:hypothetical protein